MTKNKIGIVEEFLHRCHGQITRIEEKRKYETSYRDMFSYSPAYEAYITEQRVSIATIECDVERLASELADYYEIQSMLRDPETRQLIDEARFINRLKGYGR